MAVIPARGGSKGIPKKNLRQIRGISLIGWAAKIVHSLPWIDQSILSTDDEDIAIEGRKHGLPLPFMRPPELAADTTKSVDMWRQVWLQSEAHFNTQFDISILLEPTSPLRYKEDVERTVSVLVGGQHQAAATVSRAPAHFTPQKCLTVNESGHIGFYLQNGGHQYLRQAIPAYYFRNGICYAVRRNTLVQNGYILEDQCAAVVVERPVVNIDDLFEIELAEFLMAKDAEFDEPV